MCFDILDLVDVLDVLHLLYSLDVLDLLDVLDVRHLLYPPDVLHLLHSPHHTRQHEQHKGAGAERPPLCAVGGLKFAVVSGIFWGDVFFLSRLLPKGGLSSSLRFLWYERVRLFEIWAE